MVQLILGLLLMPWVIVKIPTLISNKRDFGRYFLPNNRLFIPKYQNFGNGLNTNNIIGFSINLLLSLLLIINGLLTLFR